MKKSISIRTTVSLLMATTLLLLIIAVGFAVNAFLTNAVTGIMVRSTTDIITQINNNAETYINGITDIAAYARNLARDTSELDASEITARLKTIVASRNDIVRIDAFGMDGRLLLTTAPAGSDADISERWFSRAIKGEGDFFFTGPRLQMLPSGQEGLVITFSQIISYGDMNRATSSAVLSIDLNFNYIRALSENANLADSGTSYQMMARSSTIPDRMRLRTVPSRKIWKVSQSMFMAHTHRVLGDMTDLQSYRQ